MTRPLITRIGFLCVLTPALGLALLAQGMQGPPGGGMGRGPRPMDDGGRGRPPGSGPGSRGGPGGYGGKTPDTLSGKWWTSPLLIRRLGLSDDQQKRIEQSFQQNRVQLIDLRAALEKEEALLEPMLASEHPQETAVFNQIDRIAAARAELEKNNSRMLFSFRLVLSPEQWKELQSLESRGTAYGRGRP